MKHFYYCLQDLVLILLTCNYFVRRKIIRGYTKSGDFKCILDAGCGTGVLSRLFSAKEYFGVDINKDVIRYARKHYPGYQFVTADLTSFVTQKFFDLVLIVGVIHHLSDQETEKFFEFIFAHTEKGAKIIIIEAISPILRWNLLGYLLRYFDKGEFIRTPTGYKRLIEKRFRIIGNSLESEGFFDYAVFLASK